MVKSQRSSRVGGFQRTLDRIFSHADIARDFSYPAPQTGISIPLKFTLLFSVFGMDKHFKVLLDGGSTVQAFFEVIDLCPIMFRLEVS